MRGERVVVGMSGGVDSSVAAALLVTAGHDAVGVTMRVWPWRESEEATSRFGSCCGSEAVDDARRVAAALGIPYYLLNMADEFDRAVIGPFAESYRRGRTPVPCVACNADLKFGTLLARAQAWDAAAVATGHYARVAHDAARDRWVLRRARDARKDQSDFLWPLTQAQLAAARFPVGELTKDEVREHARRLGLATADKPESQEICFVPDGDYAAFVERQAPAADRSGPILDRDGRRLGEHAGIHRYTVGQRKGLGVTSPRPLYVLSVHPETRAVVVGEQAALDGAKLLGKKVNWLSVPPPCRPLRARVKVRYRHLEAAATVTPLPHRRVEVHFDEPQRAITPGQAAVFYDGDVCLGGAWIEPAGA
jgi:tRNA-specific 2-thiouridylase